MTAITVFLGPSADRSAIAERLPGAELLPPLARGGLHQARERGAEVLLIIDGVFAHTLAVSPREVVDVVRDGAAVFGASSMGALRAADCRHAGVQGIGLVYRLYRAGLILSDDDVAVATEGEGEFRALSVALVNVRVALSRAVRKRLLGPDVARQIFAAAEATYFPHRTWRGILKDAGDAGRDLDPAVVRFLQSVDVKRDDALAAASQVAGAVRAAGGAGAPRRHAAPFVMEDRYPGHDRALGRSDDEIRRELCTWLFGSGRYQRYIWPLVATEPQFRDVEASGPDRPAMLRDLLAGVLASVLEDVDGFADRLWNELDFLDELDAELLRWHAAHDGAARAAARGLAPPERTLRKAREEIAIAHGVRDAAMLAECVEDERLFGAIPYAWVEGAGQAIAAARAFYAQPARPESHDHQTDHAKESFR
jgi:hypothetical protein